MARWRSSSPGRASSTASDSSTIAIGRRPLARSVSPVDTRSTMASAASSRGASSTDPWMAVISASSPRSARNRRVVSGCDVAMRRPASCSTVVIGSPSRTATCSEQRPKPRSASTSTCDCDSAIWFRPAIAISTAPSCVQAGMSSERASSTSMSHWEQWECSTRPVMSTSTPALRARSSAGWCMRPLLGSASRNGRVADGVIATSAGPAGRAPADIRPRRGAASAPPA